MIDAGATRALRLGFAFELTFRFILRARQMTQDRESDEDPKHVHAELPARGRPLLRRGPLARGRPVGGLRGARARAARTRSRWSSTTGASPTTSCAAPRSRCPARLAAGWVQPGDVVVLLGRHSIEAAVAMLGCLHRGVVLAPLPPMFNVAQLSALAAQTRAKAIVAFGGEKEIAKCEQAAALVEQLDPRCCPRPLDELIAEDAADERSERRRRRRRDGHALLRHDVGAEGHRALEQHAALRDRGHLPALGAHAATTVYLVARRVRLRRRPRLRLLPGAAQRRHRRADEPVGRRGGAPAHRGAPLHLRAADADARRRHAAGGAGDDARPVVDARAGRARASRRSAGSRCGRRSGSRRWPTTASPRCPATPRTACTSRRRRCSRPRAGPTTAPRSASSATTARRCRPGRSATSSSTARAASCASSATTSSRASR